MVFDATRPPKLCHAYYFILFFQEKKLCSRCPHKLIMHVVVKPRRDTETVTRHTFTEIRRYKVVQR